MTATTKDANLSESQSAPQNLGQLLRQRVAASPEKDFLFSESDGRRFSYTQFEQAVTRAAHLLQSHGVVKDDVVSLLMPNSAEYIIAYFACWQLGALAGPVNSLLKEEEVSFVMNNSAAKTILIHSEFQARLAKIRKDLPHLKSVIVFDDEAMATRDFANRSSTNLSLSDSSLPDISLADEAIIIYTSGTTGKPKGCFKGRSLVEHHAVVSHERGFSNNAVGPTCRRLDRSKSQVFRIAFLANNF